MRNALPTYRFVFSVLLLFAVLLRSAVPIGFMPKQAMVICTSSGSETIYVSQDKIPTTEHKQAKGEHCPFAPVFASALAATLPTFMPPVYAADISIAYADFAGVGTISKSYLAQAPPVFLG